MSIQKKIYIYIYIYNFDYDILNNETSKYYKNIYTYKFIKKK